MLSLFLLCVAGNERQKGAVLGLLAGRVVALAMQMYGCRVIQKALEACRPQALVPLVREFDGSVLECVHDQNGNHVLQVFIYIYSHIFFFKIFKINIDDAQEYA